MALITWTSDLNINISKFDQQHKELVNMINNLHNAMKERKSGEVLNNIVSGLITYTDKHFKDEEKEMQKHGYSDMPDHIKQHTMFVQKVLNFKKDLDAKKIGLSIEIINFLKDWLINHIKGEDAKYGPFFLEKGL